MERATCLAVGCPLDGRVRHCRHVRERSSTSLRAVDAHTADIVADLLCKRYLWFRLAIGRVDEHVPHRAITFARRGIDDCGAEWFARGILPRVGSRAHVLRE